MAGRMPSRRLVQSGALQCLQCHSVIPPSTTLSIEGRRTLFGFLSRGKKAAPQQGGPTNPVLDEYLKRKPSKTAADQPQAVRGDLASSSIFDDSPSTQQRDGRAVEGEEREPEISRANRALVLDPKPRTRERWQTKMVAREVQKGGRLSRVQFIKRTERESHTRSQNMKTSIKKLGPLTRQIAGKTIDDAITQMRFSKKKVAKEVLAHLEFARDKAIVTRGMGLGATIKADVDAETALLGPTTTKPTEIQLKNGKRHRVADPSKIYVDQAWVGRGPFGRLPDFRARGQMNLMRTPWTSMSVVLKEEATRVREYKEREDKRRRQRENKVWTPLPDRPISSQRQWYSW